jgi:hypothetical protein
MLHNRIQMGESGLQPPLNSQWSKARQRQAAEEPVRILVRERPGEGAVLTRGVVSECFWWGIFEPALRVRGVQMIERCLQFTELVLGEDAQVIQDALGLRVLDYPFGWFAELRAWLASARGAGSQLWLTAVLR